MYSVGTDAAIEISSLCSFSSGAISSTTLPTVCGFTHSRITSEFRTAARLSVPTEICASEMFFRAWPPCCTVAEIFLGETRPFFRKASINMPPIFPAPSTANRSGLEDSVIPWFPFRLGR